MSQQAVTFAYGTEASILSGEPTKGRIFFALDTHKIYYGNSTSFILMGSSSGGSGASDIPNEVLEFLQNRIEGLECELINNSPELAMYVNQHALIISGRGANVVGNDLNLNSLFVKTQMYTN